MDTNCPFRNEHGSCIYGARHRIDNHAIKVHEIREDCGTHIVIDSKFLHFDRDGRPVVINPNTGWVDWTATGSEIAA